MATSGELLQLSSEANWRRQIARRLGGISLDVAATTGFFYMPSCAGVPVGTPDPIAGMVPMVIDSTTGVLYAYTSGVWASV